MADHVSNNLSGELIEEDPELTLEQLCRRCGVTTEQIAVFVEEGLIEPATGARGTWRFASVSIIRVKKVYRLQRELRLNPAGAVLALHLMDEIELLKARLQKFERE